jgi:hypothetical protein
MARNLSTTPQPPSWRHMAPCCAFPAHTPLHKTARPNPVYSQQFCMNPSSCIHATIILGRGSFYLLNRRPSSCINSEVPHTRLYRVPPIYDHLRVFGCLCYPNLQATSPHKLAPRSTACVFLGYPSFHKGYRCLDLSTRRIMISCHVIFDEFQFPFAHSSPAPDRPSLDFLVDETADTIPCATNDADSPLPAPPIQSAPAVALSRADVEQLLSPSAGPGGRGSAPVWTSASTTGRAARCSRACSRPIALLHASPRRTSTYFDCDFSS